MIGLKRGTVELKPYQNEWHSNFQQAKASIKKVFDNISCEIEHIGSTAVSNMDAKPIIDIAIGIKNLSDEVIETMIPKLEKLGFIYRGNEGEEGGYLFIKQKPANITTHHCLLYTSPSPRDS